MCNAPLSQFFFNGLPETIPLTMLALSFARRDLKPARVLAIAALLSTAVAVFRHYHVFFGVNLIFIIGFLTGALYLNNQRDPVRSAAAALFAVLFVCVLDLLSLILAHAFWPQHYNGTQSICLEMARALPYELILFGLAIYICKLNQKCFAGKAILKKPAGWQ